MDALPTMWVRDLHCEVQSQFPSITRVSSKLIDPFQIFHRLLVQILTSPLEDKVMIDFADMLLTECVTARLPEYDQL